MSLGGSTTLPPGVFRKDVKVNGLHIEMMQGYHSKWVSTAGLAKLLIMNQLREVLRMMSGRGIIRERSSSFVNLCQEEPELGRFPERK